MKKFFCNFYILNKYVKNKFLRIVKALRVHIFILLTAVRNIKIQTRLMGSFFILSLIPLLITGVFSYNKSSNAIRSKISTSSIQVVNQVSKNIKSGLERLEYDSVDIALSDNVQKVLSNYANMGEFDKYDAELKLQDTVVKKFSFLHYVSDVLLYTTKNDKIVAYGDNNIFKFNIETQFLNNFLKEAYEKQGSPVWGVINKDNEIHIINRPEIANDRRNGIIICRSIKDVTASEQTGYLSNGNQIGFILIRTDEKYISDTYKDINIGDGADMFVMNSKGIIISSINSQIEISKKIKQKFFLNNFYKSKGNKNQVFSFSNGKESSLVSYSPIVDTDWFVVSMIPFSYLNKESYKIGVYTFLVEIICFFMAVLLSLFISKSISLPLRKLIKSMNATRKGNLSSNISDLSRDEITEVSRNYNAMLLDINTLLENIKNKEKQKRAAELKTLQAQINPHFLSNTLNTAKWLANIQNVSNIENLITALIDLLHGSIGKGEGLISVREEIDYLKSYILIQEYKYCDKFKVRFEIQDEVLDLKILKFLLQPLVENSIIHGIEPLDGQGLIVVKAYLQDEQLKIKINDNGIGISQEDINNMLYEDKLSKKSKFSGIGVSNVEERIKLFFDEKYGIYIESVPFVLTTFELTLPIIKGEV